MATPYYGYKLLQGEELLLGDLHATAQAALATQLGNFLAALHAPSLFAQFAPRLPHAVHGVLSIKTLGDKALRALAGLTHADALHWHQAVRQWLHGCDPTALPPCPRMVHGDLHLRHILIDSLGSLVAVIDWGDLHIGHPAIDLSLYWSAFDPPARTLFEQAYGALSAPWLNLAGAMALYSCAALALHAQETQQTAALQGALRGLQRCLVGLHVAVTPPAAGTPAP